MLVEIVKWTSYVLTALFGLLFAAACIYLAWEDREEKRISKEKRLRSEAAYASRQAVAYASVALGLRDPFFFEYIFRRESFPGSLAFGGGDKWDTESVASTFGRFDDGRMSISLSALWARSDWPENEKYYIAFEIDFPKWKGALPRLSLSTSNGGRLDVMADAAAMSRDGWWGVIDVQGLADYIGPYTLYIHDIDDEVRVLDLFENEEFLDAILPLGKRGVIMEMGGRDVFGYDALRVFWRVDTSPSEMAHMSERHLSEEWVMRMFCDTVSIAEGLLKAVGDREIRLPHPPVCDEWR